MSSSPDFHLRLLGSASLTGADGVPLGGGVGQRHRLALLAVLARSPTAGVGRDVLMAHLWPESDVDQARNLLKVSVYVLRRALGEDAILSLSDGLRLAADIVDVDVATFESALSRGDHRGAVAHYGGPFLEGFFLKDSPEFGHWMDRERAQLSDAYARALESLADDAEGRDDLRGASEWWKVRAGHDPYDSRVACRLMQALAADGNHAAAMRHAAIHSQLLRGELGIEPSADVLDLAERLRLGRDVRHIPVEVNTAPPSSAGEAGIPTTSSHRPEPTTVEHARRRLPAVVAVPLLALAAVVTLLGLWSRDRRAGARDPGTTAEDIARAVVREMGNQPGQLTVAQDARRGTTNVTAWDLYRRGSQPEALRDDAASREALALFRQAVELDSSFAGAHAGMARLHLRVGPPEDPAMLLVDRLTLAKRHASIATALDDSLAEAQGTLGIAEMSLYQFAEAEAHLKRAIELDVASARAREWLVHLYVWMGRFDDALEQATRALEIDPLSPSARGELARALLVTGRCDEALEELAPLADMRPPLLRAGLIAAQCHAQKGMWDDAVADITKGIRSSGAQGQASLGFFLGRAGRRGEATAVLAGLHEDSLRAGDGAFPVAIVYAGLGQIDESFAWLDRAVDDHSLTFEIMEPRFADLRTDPRFPLLLERVGLHPQ